jgi:hypothetical protein
MFDWIDTQKRAMRAAEVAHGCVTFDCDATAAADVSVDISGINDSSIRRLKWTKDDLYGVSANICRMTWILPERG